jgi:hypothetical protein
MHKRNQALCYRPSEGWLKSSAQLPQRSDKIGDLPNNAQDRPSGACCRQIFSSKSASFGTFQIFSVTKPSVPVGAGKIEFFSASEESLGI